MAGRPQVQRDGNCKGTWQRPRRRRPSDDAPAVAGIRLEYARLTVAASMGPQANLMPVWRFSVSGSVGRLPDASVSGQPVLLPESGLCHTLQAAATAGKRKCSSFSGAPTRTK